MEPGAQERRQEGQEDEELRSRPEAHRGARRTGWEEKEKEGEIEGGWSDSELQKLFWRHFARGDRPGGEQRHRPGSADHARSQMDQDALADLPSHDRRVTSGVKILSYFHQHIKVPYASHQRELREMYTLGASLDLLCTGDVARVGDALAARFIALHQSLLDQNWPTARHMELFPLELGGHIQPSAILKKARQASGEGARQGHRQLEWLGQSRQRQRKRRLELCQRVRRQGQERKRRKQGQEQEQRLGEPGERRGGLGEDPGQARSRQISPDSAGLLAKAVQPDRPGLITILHESEQLEEKIHGKKTTLGNTYPSGNRLAKGNPGRGTTAFTMASSV